MKLALPVKAPKKPPVAAAGVLVSDWPMTVLLAVAFATAPLARSRELTAELTDAGVLVGSVGPPAAVTAGAEVVGVVAVGGQSSRVQAVRRMGRLRGSTASHSD